MTTDALTPGLVPSGRNGHAAVAPTRLLGSVVAGSLTRGLDVRLEAGVDVEQMAVGRYVTIESGGYTFFGMVTDVELRATSETVQQSPPALDDGFLRAVYQGTAAYAVLKVAPMLRLAADAVTPEPVRTVPTHFAATHEASAEQVARVFGRDDTTHFPIGMPLDMDLEICLDAERLVERSTGIFGKTGTGKTFLARNILMHLIDKSRAQPDRARRAVHLVFDMHNDYGWEAKSEETGRAVKGLKQVMGQDVVVLTLDPDSSRRRRARTDAEVTLRYEDLEPGDLAVLKDTLNLTEPAVEAAAVLAGRYGRGWLARTLAALDADEELPADTIHRASLGNLRRGLQRLQRMPFLQAEGRTDSLRTILTHLLAGRSVVLEFGQWGNDLAAYMLVANVLTRRIHREYRERVEAALGGGADPVNHLVITIEEAHKFLAPDVQHHTIFGQIAREMRKYHVTLLVIDQRPSMIDEEVRSQFGTRIACLLDNERDIDAVLGGTSGARELRAVLAKLETKRQALILGHAVPMPVVVRTEEYGSEESYARFAPKLARGAVDDLYA
jgi:DNA helicase HerA-like ATPase